MIAFYFEHSQDEGISKAAHTRGVVGGAVMLTIFGGLWCIIALAHGATRPSWSIPAGAAATLVLLIGCVARLMASRNIASIDDPVVAAKGKSDRAASK